jgi:hypothetical protein
MGRFGPAIGSAGRFFWAQRRCLVTVLCDLSLALPLFPLRIGAVAFSQAFVLASQGQFPFRFAAVFQ